LAIGFLDYNNLGWSTLQAKKHSLEGGNCKKMNNDFLSPKKIALECKSIYVFFNFLIEKKLTLWNLYTFSNRRNRKPKLTKLDPTNILVTSSKKLESF